MHVCELREKLLRLLLVSWSCSELNMLMKMMYELKLSGFYNVESCTHSCFLNIFQRAARERAMLEKQRARAMELERQKAERERIQREEQERLQHMYQRNLEAEAKMLERERLEREGREARERGQR